MSVLADLRTWVSQYLSRAAPVTLLANQINNIIQSEVVAEVKFNV